MYAVWFLLTQTNIAFMQLNLISLIPPIIAGLVGGAVSAVIAPSHKKTISIIAALLAILPMIFLLFQNGFSHFGRNPFLWYWPFYLPLFSIIGAALTEVYLKLYIKKRKFD